MNELHCLLVALPVEARHELSEELRPLGKTWADLESVVAQTGTIPWPSVVSALARMASSASRDVPQSTDGDAPFDDIHANLVGELASLGRNDAYGDGDYWIVDDDYGDMLMHVHIFNANVFDDRFRLACQTALSKFPAWAIEISVNESDDTILVGHL